ncbi:MAG: hypothetical protein P8Y70_17530 [Candidatus Lokiarchaeota archaeon]
MPIIKEKDLFLPVKVKDSFDFSEIFIIEKESLHAEIFIHDEELIE